MRSPSGLTLRPFPPALRLLSSGLVDPHGLILETFAFDQLLHVHSAAAPGTLKILLAP